MSFHSQMDHRRVRSRGSRNAINKAGASPATRKLGFSGASGALSASRLRRGKIHGGVAHATSTSFLQLASTCLSNPLWHQSLKLKTCNGSSNPDPHLHRRLHPLPPPLQNVPIHLHLLPPKLLATPIPPWSPTMGSHNRRQRRNRPRIRT